MTLHFSEVNVVCCVFVNASQYYICMSVFSGLMCHSII